MKRNETKSSGLSEKSKNNRQSPKSAFGNFLKFFSKWSLIGIILILILISIIIEIKFQSAFFVSVISRLLETIGIALMVASVFDFSKNSSEFTNVVSNILSDIIVSKSFLTKLSEGDKKNALSLVLQPTDKQIEQYSNINEYFNKQIDSTMKIFNTNFKSHSVLEVEVGKENGLVVTRGTMSYRIYKIQDKYEPIIVTFEREGSKILKKRILYSGGSRPIDVDFEKAKKEKIAGIDYLKYEYEIPDDLNRFSYLTIESEIYEPGFDHWTNFHWTSLTPYDGFSFSLICKDNLVIHEQIVFDEKTPYDVQCSDDRKSLKILSTEWLNAYTGFSITIGEENEKLVSEERNNDSDE